MIGCCILNGNKFLWLSYDTKSGELKMKEREFNEAEYLGANPDVAAAVKEGKFHSGREHYEKYGEREGRILNRLLGRTSRKEKVFHLLDTTGLGLEIGPSHNPIAPKKKGFNVQILDHASAEELRSKYQGHDVDLDSIEEVDFVWHGEPFQELIGKTGCYDWIIASHVIEHVPDLISYLQQCEILLKSTGILSLVIPDKRYCFDYFSSTSSTGNVLDAYAEKRIRPSHGQIFDHLSNACKRNGKITWSSDGMDGADELVHTFAVAQAHWARSVSTMDYIDVHCWRFTPASFRLMVSDLRGLGLINLEIKAEFDTTGCEFYVSLGKKSDASIPLDRLTALQIRKLENA
jgi:predicted SAM-dependent methyltransferase